MTGGIQILVCSVLLLPVGRGAESMMVEHDNNPKRKSGKNVPRLNKISPTGDADVLF
jgi:hypothetical protein